MFPDKGYRQPFKGLYLILACNQQLVHEDKVKGLGLSTVTGLGAVDNTIRKLTYVCPVCQMQHCSTLEG